MFNYFSVELFIHKIITFHLSLSLVIHSSSKSLMPFSINIHYSYLINLPLLFTMNWDPLIAKCLTSHFDNSSMLVAHCTEKIFIMVPSYYNIMQVFVHWLAKSTSWLLRPKKIGLNKKLFPHDISELRTHFMCLVFCSGSFLEAQSYNTPALREKLPHSKKDILKA